MLITLYIKVYLELLKANSILKFCGNAYYKSMHGFPFAIKLSCLFKFYFRYFKIFVYLHWKGKYKIDLSKKKISVHMVTPQVAPMIRAELEGSPEPGAFSVSPIVVQLQRL